MAVTKRTSGAKAPKSTASGGRTTVTSSRTTEGRPEPAEATASAEVKEPETPPTETKTDQPRESADPENPAGVPEIEPRISTFRVEPEPEKPKRGQIPARASFYLVPQTGELHNRPGPGWVELTPEQTAVAEVLPRRKRTAWWRQQQRKRDAAGR